MESPAPVEVPISAPVETPVEVPASASVETPASVAPVVVPAEAPVSTPAPISASAPVETPALVAPASAPVDTPAPVAPVVPASVAPASASASVPVAPASAPVVPASAPVPVPVPASAPVVPASAPIAPAPVSASVPTTPPAKVEDDKKSKKDKKKAEKEKKKADKAKKAVDKKAKKDGEKKTKEEAKLKKKQEEEVKKSLANLTPKGNVLQKSLLIGINYLGTPSQLSGCINDMDNLTQKLTTLGVLQKDSITLMTDYQTGANYPTKANILAQLQKLLQFAINNSSSTVQLLVAYSGHGTYLRDQNGDESDGKDEALCPVDYNNSGFLSDDQLNSVFLSKLPKNVQLVMLIDACHSGTMGDLKYNYKMDTKNTITVFNNYSDTPAQIIMLSGCLDTQTSADAYLYDNVQKKYEYQGAMTAAFLANFQIGISSYNLVKNMRDWLTKAKMDQIVQFSSGCSVLTSNPFILSGFKSIKGSK